MNDSPLRTALRELRDDFSLAAKQHSDLHTRVCSGIPMYDAHPDWYRLITPESPAASLNHFFERIDNGTSGVTCEYRNTGTIEAIHAFGALAVRGSRLLPDDEVTRSPFSSLGAGVTLDFSDESVWIRFVLTTFRDKLPTHIQTRTFKPIEKSDPVTISHLAFDLFTASAIAIDLSTQREPNVVADPESVILTGVEFSLIAHVSEATANRIKAKEPLTLGMARRARRLQRSEAKEDENDIEERFREARKGKNW